MWEALSNILTNINTVPMLFCLIIIFVLAGIMIKNGIIKVKTNHVTIGNDDERDIIRQQAEYAHAYVMGLTDFIITDREEFTKYILEVMYDEVIMWIVFNHFSLDNAYIKVKTNALHAKICSMDITDNYKTDEFKNTMQNWVYDLVKNLIEIREAHK